MLSLTFIVELLLSGAAAGFLAGLLGIGGGLIIVPAMVAALEYAHLGGYYVQHLAVGTSLAVMVFTSLSSVWTHHRNHAVEWSVVRRMTLPMAFGSLVGTQIAAKIPNQGMQWLFVAYAYSVTLQLLLDNKPTAKLGQSRHLGLWGIGGLIGLLASFVGIGGGSMSVPFLSWQQMSLPRAIATSAALGWPIALSGTIGYLISGWGTADLPPGTVGFVYLPATLFLVGTAVITAPLGASLAHTLPVAKLRKIFALFMATVASSMLLNTF